MWVSGDCIVIWYLHKLGNVHHNESISVQSYCNIIDHISYAVYYIPVTYLFYKWRFINLNPFHLFHPDFTPSGNYLFVLCESVSVLFSFFVGCLICWSLLHSSKCSFIALLRSVVFKLHFEFLSNSPFTFALYLLDFPGGPDGKASAYNARDSASIPGVGKILWRRKWNCPLLPLSPLTLNLSQDQGLFQ